jgi:nucleoside-diphosphate-sugar epimerase
MTPVDFVAAAILHIASDPAAEGETYHVANPEPPTAGEVFDWLEEQGHRLERVPHDEWLQRLDTAPPEEGSPGEVVRATAPAAEDLRDDNTYDDHNTRRALSDGGPTRPAIDGKLMQTYARYFAQQGWIVTSGIGKQVSAGSA